jgi:uracil-DNA glycosylase family 4
MPALPNRPPCGVCPRNKPNPRNKDGAPIQLVHPTGPTSCDVLFVGEGPGRDENRKGWAFIGKTGRELDDCYLPLAGLNRSDVYVTNAMKCQTWDGESPDPDTARVCGNHWLPDEIAQVNPKFIILMGGVAARSILPPIDAGRVDLDTHHGMLYGKLEYTGDASQWVWNCSQPRLYQFPQRHNIIITYHPAAGLHGSEMMTPLLGDFRAIRHIMDSVENGQYPHLVDAYPFPQYKEITTAAQVLDALHPARSITRGRWVFADTETDGLTGPPWCLSFSTSPGTGWVIPVDATEALGAFGWWVTHDPFIKVGLHNAMFDLDVMGRMGLTGFQWRDTMHTAYQLGDEPQALKPLAFRSTGMEMVDYSEVVRFPSIQPVMDWAGKLQTNITGAIPVKVPRKKLVLDSSHKFWKKHAGLLNRRTVKLHDWRLAETFGEGKGGTFPDPWKWWAEREPNVRGMLSMFGGGEMPAESIIHVSRGRAIEYASRDADATLRVWLALRRRISQLTKVVRKGEHTPFAQIEKYSTTRF